MKEWFNKGEHWIWLSSAMVSISVVLVFGLLAMITYKGSVHFWPHSVKEIQVQQGDQVETVIGEIRDDKIKEVFVAKGESPREIPQYLLRVGNRDVYGIDFRWISDEHILGGEDKFEKLAEDVIVIERYEYGNVYGHIKSVEVNGKTVDQPEAALQQLHTQVEQGNELHGQIKQIEKFDIGAINYAIEQLRLEEKLLRANNEFSSQEEQRLNNERAQLQSEFEDYQKTGSDALRSAGDAWFDHRGGQQWQAAGCAGQENRPFLATKQYGIWREDGFLLQLGG
jgi:phosphate transport system permease protein